MSDDYKKDYLDADLIDLKDKFGDKRGFIQPLCDLNMKSASLIYTKLISGEQIIIIKRLAFYLCHQREFEYYFKKLMSMKKFKK